MIHCTDQTTLSADRVLLEVLADYMYRHCRGPLYWRRPSASGLGARVVIACGLIFAL